MTPPSDFDELLKRLEAIPAHPRSLTGPKNWLNGALLFSDYVASVPPRMARLTAPLRKYPDDFEKVTFPSLDGTRLAGWFGRSPSADEGARPGLILLPGLFTSKDNNRIRARSVRMRREWGFHVLTLDLRGIGESERRYSTPGLKEAEDILAAIDWFQLNAHVRPLHLYAESLAASAALLACGRAGQEGKRLLDGNVMSVSPYGDPRPIIERFSGPIDWHDRTFSPVKMFFKGVLRMSGMGHTEFKAYCDSAARSYGLDLDQLIEASAAREVIAECRSPTLVIHSEDDVMVPVEDARDLARRAAANPNVKVRILPWGNHCLYEMAEPDWYWSTLTQYFGAAAGDRPVKP